MALTGILVLRMTVSSLPPTLTLTGRADFCKELEDLQCILTVEANPASTTMAFLAAFLDFNRGLQSGGPAGNARVSRASADDLLSDCLRRFSADGSTVPVTPVLCSPCVS